MGWGSLGSIVGGVRGSALVSVLFYVNISGMRQALTIPVPWVLLRVRWSIPLVLWFHPG